MCLTFITLTGSGKIGAVMTIPAVMALIDTDVPPGI
jgi:hypothetical protein